MHGSMMSKPQSCASIVHKDCRAVSNLLKSWFQESDDL